MSEPSEQESTIVEQQQTQESSNEQREAGTTIRITEDTVTSSGGAEETGYSFSSSTTTRRAYSSVLDDDDDIGSVSSYRSSNRLTSKYSSSRYGAGDDDDLGGSSALTSRYSSSRYSAAGDDNELGGSTLTSRYSSSRYSAAGEDNETGGASALTSRYSSSRFSTAGDDELGGSTLTSRYSSSRYSAAGDDNETGGSSALTSRYSSSRFRSSYLDDDDVGSSSTRTTRLSRYAREADEDYGLSSTSRYSRLSSTLRDDDDDYSGGYSSRRTARLTSSYLSRKDDDDDDFDRMSTSSRHSRYSSSRRYTSDLADSLYRVSSPGIDDDDTASTTSASKRFSTQYSIDSVDDSLGGSSAIRRRYQSSRSVSRTDPKDAGQVYEAILDYKPPRAATDEISLREGQEVIVIDKQKPHKWLVRTRKSKNFTTVSEGYAPSAYLKATNETVEVEGRSASQEPGSLGGGEPSTPTKDDAAVQRDLKKKKDMIVRELIETEEDLIRDMQLVQRTYIRQSESAITPKEIKAVKDQIFSCYKDLLNFHNNHLLKNFQTLKDDPSKIGTLFLKMEEQFEDHTKYCKNLPKALEILDENLDVAEFFANYAVKVRDDKSLADHLKLPYQRISDYQLLLKEISKHLSRMGENVGDLEKAIKLVGTIPNKDGDDDESQAAKQQHQDRPDSAAMGERLSDKLKNVLQAKGYVDLVDSMGKTEERFVFLFKTRLFIAEVNKDAQEGQRAYETKQIIQLSDIEVEQDRDKPNLLIIKSKDLTDHGYPIGLKCKTVQQASEWFDIMSREPEPEIDEEIDIDTDKLMKVPLPLTPEPSSDVTPTPTPTPSSVQEKVVDENNNSKLKKDLKLNLVENGKTEETSANNDPNAPKTPKTSDTVEERPFSFKTAGRRESLTAEEAEEIKKLIQKQDEKLNRNKLRIVEPLKAVTRHWGEMAVFQCQIQSDTPTNVQWLKDNRILAGNNYRTVKRDNNLYVLELMDLCPDDAGMYTFVASNNKDSASSSSTLNVLSADSRPTSPGGSFLPHEPKFKVKLKNTELLEGTTVRFELIVRGLPIPQLTFFKNGQPLQEDDHLKIVYQSKEVFEIVFDNIKQSDAGRYKVRAVNPEGEDITEADITVNTTKDVFWGLPKDAMQRAAVEEARARSHSRAHSPAFKWFRDGNEFEASERFQVQYDTEEDNIVLIFQHVKPEDAGLYTCVASTSSSKITCSAELTVQGMVKPLEKPPMQPEIKKQLTDIKSSVGENVVMLEAQVVGYPRPKMVWLHEGQEIIADERHKILIEDEEKCALVIKNLEEDDRGKYKLRAVNELGQAETEAELTVCKKPKVQMLQEKIEVFDQEELMIKVKYEAVPAPKVMWLKDGVEIKDSLKRVKQGQDETEASLLIQKASIEDTGLYTCQVTNDLGSTQATAEAVVNSSPKFLKRMEAIEILEDEQATFEVIVSNSSPKAEVEWYYGTKRLEITEKVKFFEESNGRYLLTVLKCKQNEGGQYRCKTMNKYGGEECEATLTIKRLEAMPEFTQTLKNIEATIEETNIKFEVVTSGEPKPTFKWLHNGEVLTSGTKGVKIQDTEKGSALILEKIVAESHGQYVCQAENVSGKIESSANLIVVGPPYVVKHLEDQGMPLDSQVKLTAIVKGNPQPEVVWYCNGKSVKLEAGKRVAGYDETAAEYSLTIYKLANEDIGDYRLEAKNKFGACESKAKLDIVAKPLFTKVLKNVQCKLMETNVEFVVQLDKHDAKTAVKWFKDDKEITPADSKFKMVEEKKDNSYKLTVLKATEEMVGKIKAQATNECGSAETTARLDILKAPKFLEGLQDITVKEGENVALKVLIDACPAAEIVLLKDGREAPLKMAMKEPSANGGAPYEAQLISVKTLDAGVWECRATNAEGVAASKATLLVQSSPKIEQDLADAQVGQGREIVLELVIANSEPAPAVKWLKNGAPIQLGDRARVEQPGEGRHILRIPDAMEADSGAYQAIIENPLGVAQSKSANVEVSQKLQAPKFVKKIEDAVVVVEDSVRFEAKIEAIPDADVTWYRDGAPLKKNDRIAMKMEDGSHILILRHLTIEDSGTISCKATNPAGSVTDTATLDVHEPTLPTITGLKDTQVLEGEPFKLVATVTGFPRPFVSWFYEGVEIESDIAYSEPQNQLYTLNFKSFMAENAGEYTCRAANSAGQALEQCEILLGGAKPRFIKELEEDITMSVAKENGKLKMGQAAIFETIVVGAPMPEVIWMKNYVQLKASDRILITKPEDETNGEHRMEIKNITKDDVASYTCKAVNQYGTAQSICLLKYLNEPHQPIIKKPLEDVRIEEGEPLVLFCKVDGEPMPSVKWFKNDQPLETIDDHMKIFSAADGGTKLVIEAALMTDAAKYEVRAENVKGLAATASVVKVDKPQRPPKFVRALPDEIKVEHNSPIILEAEIFGLPVPTVLWAKDGKPIKDSTPKMKVSETDGPKEGEKICRLEIVKGTQEDIGLYTLKVTNPNGEALGESHVKVQPEPQAPMILENLPVKVQIVEGEPLEIHAKVASYPLPEVRWARDNVPITEADQRVQVIVNPDGNLTLKIDPASVKDSGVISLTVANPVGELAITTKVEVAPKESVEDAQKKPEEEQTAKKPEEEPAQKKVEEVAKPQEATVDDADKKKPVEAKDSGDDDSKNKKTIGEAEPEESNKQDGLDRDKREGQDGVLDSGLDASSKLETGEDTSGKFPSHDKVEDVHKSRVPEIQKPDFQEQPSTPIERPTIENLQEKLKQNNSNLLQAPTDGALKTPPISTDVNKQRKLSVPQQEQQQNVGKIEDSHEILVSPDKSQQADERPKSIKKKSVKKTRSVKDKPEDLSGEKSKSLQKKPAERQESLKTPEDVTQQKNIPDSVIIEDVSDESPMSIASKSLEKQQSLSSEDATQQRNIPDYVVIEDYSDEKPQSVKRKSFQKQDSLKTPDEVRQQKNIPDSVVIEDVSEERPKSLKKKSVKKQDSVKTPEEVDQQKNIPDSVVVDDVSEEKPKSIKKKSVKKRSVKQKPEEAEQGDAPTILKGLEDQKVPEDADVKLTARIKGTSEPDVVWYKDDGPVKLDKKKKIANYDEETTEYSLTILKFDDQDAGQYRLEAMNTFGIVVTRATIELVGRPQLNKARDAKLRKSSTESLQGRALIVDKQKPGDAEQGDAPMILKGLADQKVPEDSDVKLTATIKGTPEPDVVWYKDDVPIKLDKKKKIANYDEAATEYSLTILKFDDQDAGQYRLEAMNNFGIVVTRATVEIVGRPPLNRAQDAKLRKSSTESLQGRAPIVVKHLDNRNAARNTGVNLTAIIKGEPQPEVVWYHNDIPIKLPGNKNVSSGHDETAATYNLTIFKFSDSDIGEYRLDAKNEFGVCTTRARLDVFDRTVGLKSQDSVAQESNDLVRSGRAPFVIKHLDNQVTRRDAEVTLTAVIKGDPEPEVVWYRNDVPIKLPGNKKVSASYDETSATYNLTIFKFTDDEIGEYRLEAKNELGVCATKALLDIFDSGKKNRSGHAPYVVKDLDNQVAPLGTEIQLTAIIKGQPEPEVVWYHNDTPIKLKRNDKISTGHDETSATYNLTIFKFSNDDLGEYRLEAKNEFGVCLTKARLDLFDKSALIDRDEQAERRRLLEQTRALLDQTKTVLDQSKVPQDDASKIPEDEAELSERKQPDSTVDKQSTSRSADDGPEKTQEGKISQDLPAEVTLTTKEPLVLSAKIEAAPLSSDAQVVWQKDGVPVEMSEKIELTSTPTGEQVLRIPEPKKSDAGEYSLVVKTPDGVQSQMTCADVKFVTKSTPEVCFAKSLPTQVSLQPGQSLDLQLTVRSPNIVAPENVKLFKDDVLVDDKQDVQVSVQELPHGIQQVSVEKKTLATDDAGVYRVEMNIPDSVGGQQPLSTSCRVNISDKHEAQPAEPVEPKKPVEVPKIVSGLKPVEIESGQSGRLELKVDGDARAFDVAWFKDGEQIVPNEQFGILKMPDGTIALQIDSFSAGDAGEYSVKITNAQGGEVKDSTTASMKKDLTASMPVIVEQLKSVEVDEGAPLVLTTKVASPSPFKATWYFDGKPLQERDGLKFLVTPDGTVALQIDKCSPQESGKYKVEITNDSGKASTEGTATVRLGQGKNLEILRGLDSTVLTAGKSGELDMQISGPTDGLDIKFLHNGAAVLPSDRVHIQQLPNGVVRLTLDCVELGDAGEYTVIISAPGAGQVQSKCQVEVHSKPIITKHMIDLEVKEGCTAKFEIQVQGSPEPEINWMMNGRSLTTKSQAVTSSGPNGTYYLTIDKCSFRDEAVYSVSVTNDLGTDKSEGKLAVIGAEKFQESGPVFLKGLSDVTFKQGDSFILEAEIAAHPSPTLTWMKNGIPIEDGSRFTTLFDGTRATLTVTNAEMGDIGAYSLTVANKLGEVTSKAQVSAQASTIPKFVKKISSGEHKLKEDLKLTCRAEGFPDPHIRWTFNGKDIESGSKYSIFTEANGDSSLIIFAPTEFDSGVFECVASNSAGSDKTMANLQFADKDSKGEAAVFIKKLTDYDVLQGAAAYFSGCVVGTPRPDLTWFLNGAPLDISGSKYQLEYKENGMFKLEIRDVTEADLGKYQCRASNVYGSDNSIAQLSFEKIGLDRSKSTHKSMKSQARAESVELVTGGLPEALTDSPQIARMSDDSLTLVWSPSVPEKARFPVNYVIEFGKARDGVWMIYQDKIRDNKCEVVGLEKFTDYNFRVRVENKFGQSAPSPTVLAQRSQLKVEEDGHKPKEFKPEDYDIEHKERGHVAAAPKFLREEPNKMFGICGQPITVEFWVHGFPDPDIQWFCGDRLLEHGNEFSFLHDRNGRVCLFINKMSGLDAGDYTCVARNEHGEARKTITLVEAKPPVFTRKLEETTVASRGHARLEVAFEGSPECTIKWFKDFQPLHDTGRATVLKTSDSSSLALSDLIVRDSGLYTCTISNLAGSSTTSAYLKVTDAGVTFERFPSHYHSTVKAKNKNVESFYDLGDELGRGTQGITYHAVERETGKSYAAKMMHGMGETRQFMQQELDIMNQLGAHERLVQLRDAFSASPHAMTLITDICGGGTILDWILRGGSLTEAQVAEYMKQLLEGLHAMHIKNIGHFGLTIGDILLDRLNGFDVKIADFGMSARCIPGMTHYVEYGHPEFVAPEIVNKTTVTFGTDLWSAGIVAHILLTGESPFLGENDRATLQNIKEKKGLDLSDEKLKNISTDARDFLRKTLNYDSSARLDVKTALNHSWFRSARDQTSTLNIIESLRSYQSKYTKWYENAACKRYYRRRALHSCYTHPSRMIYPPDEQYSPMVSPDRELKKFQKPTVSPFDNIYPASNRPDSEPFSSESHYQSGPETYLLQLRDTGFPTRIRRYLRIAASSSPSIAASLSSSHWGGSARHTVTGFTPTVSIRERRKFTDVMDEEVNEEWRGTSYRNRPSRLLREVGTSAYAYGQMNTLRREAKLSRYGTETPDNAKAPYFREKFRDSSFQAGDEIVISCFAVGIPEPSYTWFRNESILIESSRVKVRRTQEGRCELILRPTREYDAGVYKCIARNSVGQAIVKARISLGDVPDHLVAPHAADISSNAILLSWSAPKFINAPFVKCYKLEMRTATGDWSIVETNILQQFYIVNDLRPETEYSFRLTAQNSFGWSQVGPVSEIIKTTNENKTIGLPIGMQFVCAAVEEDTKPIDYTRETQPIGLIASEFKDIYDFKSLIATGKFSAIAKAYIKDGSRATLACKCVLIQSEQESGIANEYNIMKTLSHERIVKLAYAQRDSQIFTLAMELSSGLNILTYLCRKAFYSEENVSLVISQVLDGIEYLHFRGIALLELQPDNVLVCDERRLQIKLCDFASARPVKGPNAVKVDLVTDPEFIAPEIVKSQEAYTPYTDIWCVGVLAYILLSAQSPFKGRDQKETGQNVVYVRYLFERLYSEVTQDAIRFILSVFKLTPHKRPTIEECVESKWLMPAESVIRRREVALFSSERLQKFTEEYLAAKQLPQSRLVDLLGVSRS